MEKSACRSEKKKKKIKYGSRFVAKIDVMCVKAAKKWFLAIFTLSEALYN